MVALVEDDAGDRRPGIMVAQNKKDIARMDMVGRGIIIIENDDE